LANNETLEMLGLNIDKYSELFTKFEIVIDDKTFEKVIVNTLIHVIVSPQRKPNNNNLHSLGKKPTSIKKLDDKKKLGSSIIEKPKLKNIAINNQTNEKSDKLKQKTDKISNHVTNNDDKCLLDDNYEKNYFKLQNRSFELIEQLTKERESLKEEMKLMRLKHRNIGEQK
jgi:hypothetical protein